MGFLKRYFGIQDTTSEYQSSPQAYSGGDINSEWFRELISQSGHSPRDAIRNSAINRCVNLISSGIGMLPLTLMQSGTNGQAAAKAKDHPLYKILSKKPNHWQTPFKFKRHMQRMALFNGDAFALPVHSRGEIVELLPVPKGRMKVEQADDLTVTYVLTSKNGGKRLFKPNEVFHLMGPSEDGLNGESLTDVARDVLDLSRLSDKSMKSMMSRGVRPGGMLSTDQKLSESTIAKLRKDFEANFAGVDNEGKWIIGEEGLKANPFSYSSRDAQGIEFRSQQIEEVARFFGVPRPLLMMDDTSWGSGIEQLGLFFVTYALAPWFVNWEEAIAMSLLSARDAEIYYAKYNERALLRGSMKDQAEFFSKLTGSGGSPQIIEQNEARDLLDMPAHPDGSGLNSGMGKNDAQT